MHILIISKYIVFGGRNLMYENYDADNETGGHMKTIEVLMSDLLLMC